MGLKTIKQSTMINSTSFLLLAFLTMATAFQSSFTIVSSSSSLSSANTPSRLFSIKNPLEGILRNIANNFEPIHGHGSLEEDLNEQWEVQQELLRERQRKKIDKVHLMQKYKNPEARKTCDLKVGLQQDLASPKVSSKKKNFWGKSP